MPITINGNGAISGLGDIDGHDLETATLVVSGDTTIAPQAVGRATLFVDDSANTVGINTTTPDSGVFLEVADGTNPIVRLNNTGNGEVQAGCTSVGGYIGTNSNHPFFLRSNSTEQITVLANGNVGLGTISPEENLDTTGAITWRGGLIVGKTSAGALDRSGNDIRIRAYGATAGTGELVFRTGGGGGSIDSEAARIDNDGNVGIGSSSPEARLHVEETLDHTSTYYLNADAHILVRNPSTEATSKSVIKLEGEAAIVYGGGANDLIFADRHNERMRLTNQGVLLLNQAVSSPNLSNLSPFLQINEGSGIAMSIQRNSGNDGFGANLMFRKSRSSTPDGTTSVNSGDSLGQIQWTGTEGTQAISAAYIQCIVGGTPSPGIVPGQIRFITRNTSGSSGERLRIQANGGISFNGDGAAANALDDYEEGTWTPDFTRQTSTGFTRTLGPDNEGIYTKIGNLVTVSFGLDITWSGGSGFFYLLNLPYAVVANLPYMGTVGFMKPFGYTNKNIAINGHFNTGYFWFSKMEGSSGTNDDIVSGTTYYGSFTYHTTA